VLQELQADCFAGIWAHHAEQQRHILEPGDVEEGLKAASAVGDDTLQRRARGHVVPESFTHGSAAQRMQWFRRGLEQGTVEACDTFGAASRGQKPSP
jgi:predicted metalloprotease